jgi:hypothetical protein
VGGLNTGKNAIHLLDAHIESFRRDEEQRSAAEIVLATIDAESGRLSIARFESPIDPVTIVILHRALRPVSGISAAYVSAAAAKVARIGRVRSPLEIPHGRRAVRSIRLSAIPPTDTAALEMLLPDRWVQAHPEHQLTEREEESGEAQARRRRKRAARRAAAPAWQTADGTL